MQIGPAVSQAIGNFRELHGKCRLAISRANGNFRSAISVTIGRFLIYARECILTLNSIIFPSYTLFLVIFVFKKTVSNISDIRR